MGRIFDDLEVHLEERPDNARRWPYTFRTQVVYVYVQYQQGGGGVVVICLWYVVLLSWLKFLLFLGATLAWVSLGTCNLLIQKSIFCTAYSSTPYTIFVSSGGWYLAQWAPIDRFLLLRLTLGQVG